MTTPTVWKVQVERWSEAIRDRILSPAAELPTEFATTTEHLTPAAAARLRYRPIRRGRKWGRKWEYAWFRCKVKVPRAPKGKAFVLTGETDTESVVFVDGRPVGALNRPHRELDVSRLIKDAGVVKVLIETYAGHGPTPLHLPYLLPGKEPIPATPPAQRIFKGLWLAEWNEDAYQLWIDATTVWGLSRALPPDSLRRHRLENALKEVIALVDPEADPEIFDASLAAAKAALADLLAARNGPTMPEMFCFGHAHLDVAWLWPLEQTTRKVGATFSTALALMERYSEYRFGQSQTQLYEYARIHYPDIFNGIRRAVRRGQWIADGAMWVEPDTNIAGGEALIRQFLYGKRYFKEHFGIDSEVCWLPDVFGYSGNLPQILLGCGVKYFSTAKIFWNLYGGTTFPYETFTWEGIDGSEVLAHFHRDYNAETHPEAIAKRWTDCVHKNGTDKLLYPFGWGDGGGGPTRDHLEYLRREGDLEGLPRTRYASPREFFATLEKAGPPEARYVGELYFELHRGTYTSQARTKRGNRKCEFALRESEIWSAAAVILRGRKVPRERLEKAWKALLLNQFHDILPGSSIRRVYEEAEALYEEVLAECGKIASAARSAIASGRDGWTVWNSLSWRRDALAAVPAKGKTLQAVDDSGNVLPSQIIGRGRSRRLLVAVPGVPSVGCKTIKLLPGKPAPYPTPVTAWAGRGEIIMENEHLRLRIDKRGEITQLLDKAADRQLIRPGQAGNRLELYRDNPPAWDAWDITEPYRTAPVGVGPARRVKIVAGGPLEARVAVARKVGRSDLNQEIVLRAGSRRIDFETRVDWHETHRLLKAALPVDLSAATLRGEIQFGHVERPTHRNTEFEKARFEWPAQKWADLSEAHYGIALLNDCKYGYDILDGVLRLSLLRAPVAPDEHADQGEHAFTYALLVHNCGFAESNVVGAAYELNAPVTVEAGRYADGEFSLLHVSGSAVVVETIKVAEDGGDPVVRLYEFTGGAARARLRLASPIKSAAECDMLEKPRRKLRITKDGEIILKFRAFEIKTVRLRLKKK